MFQWLNADISFFLGKMNPSDWAIGEFIGQNKN